MDALAGLPADAGSGDFGPLRETKTLGSMLSICKLVLSQEGPRMTWPEQVYALCCGVRCKVIVIGSTVGNKNGMEIIVHSGDENIARD